MVFRSDPRAGYLKIDFNVEWFYQMLDERGEELILKKTDEKTGKDFTEAELSQREAVFERYLERAVECYIAYRIFGGRDNRIIFYKEVDLSGYEDVYELLNDCLLDFLQTYPDYFTLQAVEWKKNVEPIY